jgi:hypothetical protein
VALLLVVLLAELKYEGVVTATELKTYQHESQP